MGESLARQQQDSSISVGSQNPLLLFLRFFFFFSSANQGHLASRIGIRTEFTGTAAAAAAYADAYAEYICTGGW
jgi:hypothetical protein